RHPVMRGQTPDYRRPAGGGQEPDSPEGAPARRGWRWHEGGFVRPLYQGDGGWVSVYLETSWGPKDAADRTALRWRGARQELQAAGAAGAPWGAGAEGAPEPGPGRGCAVFARGGGVPRAPSRPAAPEPRARLAPLPDVLPMLAQVDDDVRYLQVEARR